MSLKIQQNEDWILIDSDPEIPLLSTWQVQVNNCTYLIYKYKKLNPDKIEQTIKKILKIKQLNHECLIKIESCEKKQKQNTIYVVMESIDHNNQTPILSMTDKKLILQKILQFINYLHKNNYYYGKILQENILFVPDKKILKKLKHNLLNRIILEDGHYKELMVPEITYNLIEDYQQILMFIDKFVLEKQYDPEQKNFVVYEHDKYIKLLQQSLIDKIKELKYPSKKSVDQLEIIISPDLALACQNQVLINLELQNLQINQQSINNIRYSKLPLMQSFKLQNAAFKDQLFQKFLNTQFSHGNFKSIFLKNNELMGQVFEGLQNNHHWQQLQYLDISFNKIDRSIYKLVELWPRLKYLNLENCKISNSSFSKFLKTDPKFLEQLNLNNNQIGSQQFSNQLCSSLKNMKFSSLKILHLNNNFINDTQFVYLVEMNGNNCTKLTQLGLDSNKIEMGLKFIKKDNKINDLEILSLKKNKISKDSLKNAFLRLKKLKTLFLSRTFDLEIYQNLYPKLIFQQ